MAAVPEEFERDFERAYRAHYPMLQRRSRRWLPAGEAEDAVQETFLRAWAHHHGRDPGVPWLLTVLRNLAIDRARRKVAEPVADVEALDSPDDEGPAEKVIRLEDRRAVREAMGKLTDAQRKALRLREWNGLSHEQIATSLGTSVASVESLLVRGRRRLRSVLESAMGLALWPAASLWRRFRHLPGGVESAAVAAPAAATALSTTVAQLATAAAVLLAGFASAPGRGGDTGGAEDPSHQRAGVVSSSGSEARSAIATSGTAEESPAGTPAAAVPPTEPGGSTGMGSGGTSSDGSTTGGGTVGTDPAPNTGGKLPTTGGEDPTIDPGTDPGGEPPPKEQPKTGGDLSLDDPPTATDPIDPPPTGGDDSFISVASQGT